MKTYEGLGVAVVTPFTENLDIDFNALKSILEHLIDSNGADYLVVLGSTGEAATLSANERQTVLTFIKEFNNNRLPLVFGHGGNNTQALIESLKSIDYSGYSAILSVSPAYVRPTQAGIIAHYQALADNSPLPIILYNVPSRTGSNLEANTVKALAQHPNIIGIKEASANLLQAKEINATTNDDFLLISGDDMHIVPLCSIGTRGLISVMGNAYPKLYKEIISNCMAGDFVKAAELDAKTLRINELMYKEGNPAGIKQLLAHLGLCKPYVRLPLVKATDTLSDSIKKNLI